MQQPQSDRPHYRSTPSDPIDPLTAADRQARRSLRGCKGDVRISQLGDDLFIVIKIDSADPTDKHLTDD
jgi:hypothetical protein